MCRWKLILSSLSIPPSFGCFSPSVGSSSPSLSSSSLSLGSSSPSFGSSSPSFGSSSLSVSSSSQSVGSFSPSLGSHVCRCDIGETHHNENAFSIIFMGFFSTLHLCIGGGRGSQELRKHSLQCDGGVLPRSQQLLPE